MLLFSRFNSENTVSLMISFINKLNIRISPLTIKSCLHKHPDYPSLLAISDCLTEWKIPNNAYQINKNEYNAKDLSFPLIAYIQKEGRFILINTIDNGIVNYSTKAGNNAIMSEREFLEKWTGIVLYAEASVNSNEEEYAAQFFKGALYGLRIPVLIISIFAGLFYLFFQRQITWSFAALSLLTLGGLVVSILLLIYSVNTSNPYLQNLCSLNKENNCNTILKSKEAKITDWLSWSEVGFFYFSGSLISLLLINNVFPFLAILNLCCLPYTIWSVWHQHKVNNWCVLCCTIQAILWMQFIVFTNDLSYSISSLEINTIIPIAVSFFIPIILWAFVKPFLLKAEQLTPLKQELKKFKYNSDLFNQMLTNQPCFSIPVDIMPIVLGNIEAKTIITMVSNPFCAPCATTHKTLNQWLNTRNDIQLKIIFTTANHDDDPKTKVARHLSALSLLEDKKKVEEALNDWYDSVTKEYDTWAKNYPVQTKVNMELVTQKQKEWCELTEITFTPTILINGYRLPNPYRLDDIKYLLS